MPSKQVCPLSVVIATLGNNSVFETINQMNSGFLIPAEILICIPETHVSRLEKLHFENVRIIATPFAGQVAQRAAGFKMATYDIVMQLDDDMFLDKKCISQLLKTLKASGEKVAVAPALMNRMTGLSIYKKPQRNKIVDKLYDWLMNGRAGYQQGKINKSGTPVGIDPDGSDKVFEAEWLAGGCVMHYKKNLVLENFFPFKGKAFCEDIIHSHCLQEKGVRLLVDGSAMCYMDPVYQSSFGFWEFFKSLKSDWRARKYFMQLSSRKSFRMYFFYAVSILSYLFKKLIPSQFKKTI